MRILKSAISYFRQLRLLLNQISTSSSMMISSISTSINDVHIVPMFSDNYGYILVDKATNYAAIVDGGDPAVFPSVLKELGVDLKMLLCTHKHSDHIGGNLELQRLFPDISIYGPSYEAIPGITHPLKEHDTVNLGSTRLEVLYTPCHTSGHISYFIPRNAEDSPSFLFPGDTLFVGGCGRFFEGTAAQMLANMDQYSKLPEDTLVFCAHEYTESNYRFLVSIDPQVEPQYQKIKAIRRTGAPTVPSTIAQELATNLFMKCNEKRLWQLLGVDSAEAAMLSLRESKNNFR